MADLARRTVAVALKPGAAPAIAGFAGAVFDTASRGQPGARTAGPRGRARLIKTRALRLPATPAEHRVGRLLQAALRRSRPGARLLGRYTHRVGDLQPPPPRDRRLRRPLPVAQQPPPQPAEDDHPARRGVSSAASFCTCCRPSSGGSAILTPSQPAVAASAWLCAGSSSAWPRPSPAPARRTIATASSG